jgi:hypothetical protein
VRIICFFYNESSILTACQKSEKSARGRTRKVETDEVETMDSLAFLSETAPEPIAVESAAKYAPTSLETEKTVETEPAVVEAPVLPLRQTREKSAKIKLTKKKTLVDVATDEPVPKMVVLSPLQNMLPSRAELKKVTLPSAVSPKEAFDSENVVVEPKVLFLNLIFFLCNTTFAGKKAQAVQARGFEQPVEFNNVDGRIC